MYRSSSTNRFSDEFYNTASSSSSSSSSPSPALKSTTTDPGKLPSYNPESHVAKKERSRLRSAENAIHLIPLVLVVCAIILWFFSKPVDIVVNKGDSNVPSIKGLTMDDAGSDGTQSSLLTNLELGDFDPKKVVNFKPTRLLDKKSI